MVFKLTENQKRMSGVYMIKNTVTKKVYVGSTVCFIARYRAHYSELRKNRHMNYVMQDDFHKHGDSSFVFSLLEACPESILKEREIFHINEKDSLRNGYNVKSIHYNGVSTSYKGLSIRPRKKSSGELTGHQRSWVERWAADVDLTLEEYMAIVVRPVREGKMKLDQVPDVIEKYKNKQKAVSEKIDRMVNNAVISAYKELFPVS